VDTSLLFLVLTKVSANTYIFPYKKFELLMPGEQVTMKTLIKIVAAGLLLAAVNCTKKGSEPQIVITAENCGSCHALPPADDGHTYHVAWMNYKCSYCHQGYAMDSAAGIFTVNAATHRNGNTDVVFSPPWNDSGRAAYVLASKQCNNVYCHGAIPQGTHASIHWNGSDTIRGNCVFCHDLGLTAPGIYAGHYGHSRLGTRDSAGDLVSGSNVNSCFNCHGANIADTLYSVGQKRVDPVHHIDGVFDMGTCRNCHSADNPTWTTWDEYVNTHPGAKPFGKIGIN
jgi:predicted CxxxxCH...CXXCH cytochrome family protein